MSSSGTWVSRVSGRVGVSGLQSAGPPSMRKLLYVSYSLSDHRKGPIPIQPVTYNDEGFAILSSWDFLLQHHLA